jgi:hypothetical protein
MNEVYTTQTQADSYDTTRPLLDSMYAEFKELSKKKPDAAVSKNKLKIVNRLLERVRSVLADEDSIVFLDLLDEDDLPQSSDVTLMLSQYDAAMNSFRKKYYGYNQRLSEHIWFIR